MSPSPAPPGRIEDVIARLAEIDAELPPDDGVRAFNAVYLRMTESVRVAAERGRFLDRGFVERLDVVFAQRYFDALAAFARDPGLASPAWRPLFEARRRRGVTPLRFAVAGMNAHINFDLALAVVATGEERGAAPRVGEAAHRDYLRINDVLAETSDEVKGWLLPPAVAVVDAALGRADDTAALWSLFRARDAAWAHAEASWAVRRLPGVRERLADALARFVGFASEGLLVPQLPLRSSAERA